MPSLISPKSSSPGALAKLLFRRAGKSPRVILLHGAMGTGKSTLTAQLLREGEALGVTVRCIGADPGSPEFGIPGAVCVGKWEKQQWHWLDTEALCSLDAVRFRLPLLNAVARLVHRTETEYLLIDAPGVIRGVGASELLFGFSEIIKLDAVLALHKAGTEALLGDELETLSCPVYQIYASSEASRPSAFSRRKDRTQRWDQYLSGAKISDLQLDAFNLLGTPPRTTSPRSWQGLQLAHYRGTNLQGMGEVLDRRGNSLRILMHGQPRAGDCLVLRDAQRNSAGLLATRRATSHIPSSVQPEDSDADPTFSGASSLSAGAGKIVVKLVNGVFGDPLVELQLRGARDRILFDLGDASLLSRRVLHKVTDVFISHAHFDHICGFLHLLRARMTGSYPPLRIYGPPGIHRHIIALIDGINWDRIGNAGPEFLIHEVYPGEQTGVNVLLRSTVKAGKTAQCRNKQSQTAGAILRRPEFSIHCAHLDHGIPVLAFAIKLMPQHNIRKDRLTGLQLQPGIWLKQLKQHLVEGRVDAVIELPDGQRRRVDSLSAELVDTIPGKKLVYATDFADTASNRTTLRAFAGNADIFMCEATFCNKDSAQAEITGHITTRACGEIAAAANTQRLIPFHFSKRYTDNPAKVYAEVREHCGSSRIMECGHFR